MTRHHYHRVLPLRSLLMVCCCCCGAAPLCSGGSLNPPPGPITPTHKTLTEVEPRIAINSTNTPGDADSLYRISQPGSYYLTGNVSITMGRTAIEVANSGVTIDLNGFQIFSLGGGAGLSAPNTAVERITIRNGDIVNATTAISMASIPGVTIEDIKAEACTTGGIMVGESAAVRRCYLLNCETGVSTGASSEISDVTVVDSDTGIACGSGSRIADCTVSGSAGLRAFGPGSGCVFTACTARDNTGTGFYAVTGCTLTNCSSHNNGDYGFVAVEAAAGTAGCVFANCSASYNGNSGFNCDGSTLTGCSAYFNDEEGFDLNWCRLVDSVAVSNQTSGIVAQTNCVITACISNNSGTAGISITGSNNMIDGNNCTSGATGIACSAGANFIVRNICRSNTTEWNVVAGNQCLVVLGVDAAAIVGDSGGASPGSTNPNANYTY